MMPALSEVEGLLTGIFLILTPSQPPPKGGGVAFLPQPTTPPSHLGRGLGGWVIWRGAGGEVVWKEGREQIAWEILCGEEK